MTARGEESSDLLKSLVGPPADEENEPAPAQGNLVRPPDPYRNAELEDLHVSIGKRIYAQLDMIIMAFNTINAVFAISAAVSLIPKYDYSLYSFCDYGDNGKPLSIGVQCPYLPSPVFISFLIVWCLYFLTIFSYRFHRTIDYWSNDLRFYVACDMLNNEIFMYIMVLVGIALTFVSAVGGIYFVTQNGSTASLGKITSLCRLIVHCAIAHALLR